MIVDNNVFFYYVHNIFMQGKNAQNIQSLYHYKKNYKSQLKYNQTFKEKILNHVY